MRIGQLNNPQNIKILVLMIIFLIIVVLGAKESWTLFNKYTKFQSEIAKKTTELARGSDILLQKDKENKEIKDAEDELASFEKKFTANTEELFSMFNRFAENCQFKFKLMKPLESLAIKIPNTENTYFEMPVDLRFEANFQQLLNFLKKLETAPKTIVISALKIRANQTNIWDHDVEMSLYVPMLKAERLHVAN